MRLPSGGLHLDNPSWPLLQAHVTYWGLTSAAGNVLGTTLVCADLVNEPGYVGLAVKILDGGAAGQVRPIAAYAAGIITVASAFTSSTGAVQQIAASTRFVILSISGGGAAPAPVVAPSIGLWMFGVCDPGMAASTTVLLLTNLAGFPNDIFNTEFWVQVIHNASAPGTAPEREIRRVTDYVGATGAFTCDAFTVNVEANDLVCVFHESILPTEILGFGTLTTSSATVPADAARAAAYAWETNDYFNGCLLMTTEGAVRFQPRRIVDYVTATGVFTIDPNNPFTAATGLVDYIIIGGQADFVPAADGVNNRTPSDVVGNKTDTAIAVSDAVSSQVRYLKGILNAVAGGGLANIFHEQADTPVNITAIVAGETNVLNLAVAATRYLVRHLRLKCADPGANTVTVRLYELVNDVLTVVDTFAITTANFGTYWSLMDMLGLPHLAGDRLQVTVQASGGGPYAVTGQYSLAQAT